MFDKIIVSTDDSTFVQFVPVVSRAWKKFFPECDLHIAFVTDRSEDDELVGRMRKYGEVHLFKTIEGVPTANHAKVARHLLASKQGNAVCMLEDIDTVPMQREFYEDRTSKREKDHLLAVGAEVLRNTPHEGKFPMSTITAEGDLFKELINPNNLSDTELVESWKGLALVDHKEAINNHPSTFSDESLIRALISRWENKRISHADRAVDIHKYWIDRSWWGIDDEKMHNEEYVACNFLRPMENNYEKLERVVEFIFDGDVPAEVILK